MKGDWLGGRLSCTGPKACSGSLVISLDIRNPAKPTVGGSVARYVPSLCGEQGRRLTAAVWRVCKLCGKAKQGTPPPARAPPRARSSLRKFNVAGVRRLAHTRGQKHTSGRCQFPLPKKKKFRAEGVAWMFPIASHLGRLPKLREAPSVLRTIAPRLALQQRLGNCLLRIRSYGHGARDVCYLHKQFAASFCL